MSKPQKTDKKQVPLLALRICIGLLAFLLYSNTLSHKFTLDDDFFFLKNKAVAKGVSSIGIFVWQIKLITVNRIFYVSNVRFNTGNYWKYANACGIVIGPCYTSTTGRI